MNGVGLLAILLPAWAGAFGLPAFLKTRQQSTLANLLAMVLGAYLGVGLSSALLPVVIVTFRGWPSWYVLAEALGFTILAALSVWYWNRSGPRVLPTTPTPLPDGMALILLILLGFAGLTAGLTFTSAYLAAPHGDWDATGIWNYHARFLSRDQGQFCHNMLTFPEHHPDYPLGLSANVARFWMYDRSETTLGPAILAALFLMGTTVTLLLSLTLVRDWSSGAFAALIYLIPSSVATIAALQYADGPLSFWYLAAIAVWVLAENESRLRVAIVSGLLAGLAAWTKNEGLPFAVILGLVIFARGIWSQGGKSAGRLILGYGLGCLVFVLLNLWWKSQGQHGNDLLAGQDSVWAKLGDGSRWGTVFRLGGELIFGGFGAVSLFFGLILLALGRPRVSDRGTQLGRGAVAVVGLQFGLYASIFVITPHELEWHLRTAANRLALHLWPGLVFGLVALSTSFAQRGNPERTGLTNKPD